MKDGVGSQWVRLGIQRLRFDATRPLKCIRSHHPRRPKYLSRNSRASRSAFFLEHDRFSLRNRRQTPLSLSGSNRDSRRALSLRPSRPRLRRSQDQRCGHSGRAAVGGRNATSEHTNRLNRKVRHHGRVGRVDVRPEARQPRLNDELGLSCEFFNAHRDWLAEEAYDNWSARCPLRETDSVGNCGLRRNHRSHAGEAKSRRALERFLHLHSQISSARLTPSG